MTRLLGVDLGERRIGLAVADSGTGAVRPLATIRRADPARDARTIARVCEEQRIDEIVVGLPLNMDGSEGAQAVQTRAWASTIDPLINGAIVWRDERLTSEQAAGRMERPPRGRGGGPPSASGRNSRRARIDREAAAGILQAELDARAGDTPVGEH